MHAFASTINTLRIILRADLLGFYIEVEFLGDDSDWTDGRKDVFTDAAER